MTKADRYRKGQPADVRTQEELDAAKASDAFKGKYLKTEDLQGKAFRLVIDRVIMEEIGTEDQKEKKPICYFTKGSRGMVLNTTKWDAIASITGQDDSDNWKGHVIVIRPGKTSFKGKVVPCIDVVRPG